MPRRRCVGCGRIAPKSELLRIAAVADVNTGQTRAALDLAAARPGRGAYLCRGACDCRPAAQCLALANRRGAFGRALRRSIAGDLVLKDSELVESVSP